MELFPLSISKIKDFLFSGKATFTVVSKRTNKRLTFQVEKFKKKPKEGIYFVQVLTGCNNESDYSFLGTIFQEKEFVHGKKSKISQDADSAKGFKWLMSAIQANRNDMPEQLEFYHNGYCCRCGRKLTTPQSIKDGIGPECIKLKQKENEIQGY